MARADRFPFYKHFMAATILAALIALLKAQTDLITAITASQPEDVRAKLWERFADDTQWIHAALMKINNHLEKVIGLDTQDAPK